MQSEQINELATALAKAQGEMRNVKKTADNPFFHSKYSDLASIWDAVRGPLTKHGLCVVQGLQGDEFVTTLMHCSGQFIEFREPFKPMKHDPQSIGSLKSYCRRYSLMGLAGVAAEGEDDDGETAMHRDPHPVEKAMAAVESKYRAGNPVPNKLGPKVSGKLSAPQVKRMYAIAGANKWTDEQVKQCLQARYNVASSADLTKGQYDEFCDSILPNMDFDSSMQELKESGFAGFDAGHSGGFSDDQSL